jgi:C-5 cytosine-specific DNA methylase
LWLARDGYWYIRPEEHRTISVREAACNQTLPDWFRFAGRRSDAFRQIGNAVPPMLARAAAQALLPAAADRVAVAEDTDRKGGTRGSPSGPHTNAAVPTGTSYPDPTVGRRWR